MPGTSSPTSSRRSTPPFHGDDCGADARHRHSAVTAIYLNALLRDVHVAGGAVVVGELRDRQEVAALPERVVINCTGLGAAELFGDEQLMPVKGQLTILLPQPEVDYIAIQSGLYMFPRSDGILLGGTFERGDATLEVDEEEERRIVEGHRRLFAGMRAR